MRLRIRRVSPDQLTLPEVAVANHQIPSPPRMRVRRDVAVLGLLAQREPENDVPLPKTWSNDLLAVQRGKMPFAVLAKRHKALVREVARPWMSRCSSNVGPEDLAQELLLEVWRAIEVWDADRGVPLQAYVRRRMHHRMLAYTHRLKRGREKDLRFLAQQIIEEKVVVVHSGSPDDQVVMFEPVAPADDDRDVAQVAALVVGGLPSKQARVVAGLLAGEQSDTVTARVYGSKCKRPRKAALRAFAAAAALVDSSSGDPEDHAQRTETHHVAH